MEYLQYLEVKNIAGVNPAAGFKPYYKWNTFNTKAYNEAKRKIKEVLNLIINGIPSIHKMEYSGQDVG